MDKDELLEYLINCEALFADGFGDALVGFAVRSGCHVALYDQEKCIQILMDRDGLLYDDAVEFFEFNVIGSWVGEKTPIFASLITQ